MTHDPRFFESDHELAREWAAQELALAEARAGRGPRESAPQLRTYRLMAHLLAQPPAEQLPPDFARQTARRAERAAAPRAVDSRLERILFALLAAALALAGVVVVLLYGAAWLPSLGQGPAAALLAKPWLWALAVCMGLSGLCDRWWLRRDLSA